MSRTLVTILTGLGCLGAGATASLYACCAFGHDCPPLFSYGFNSIVTIGTFLGLLGAMPATTYISITRGKYLWAKSIVCILITGLTITKLISSIPDLND